MKNFKIILIGSLLSLSFLVPVLFTTNFALADRAADFCDETVPAINADTASRNAECKRNARAVEQQCSATNGTGNTAWQQCIDNYYNGVTGTYTPSDSIIIDGATQTTELCGPSNIETDACKTDFKDKSKGCNEQELTKENCRIIEYLIIGINFLSAIAGIVIVASIMIAGFQYMTAQDNPGQIEKAKSRIIFTLLALVVFIFMYALLNFLVPGGVL